MNTNRVNNQKIKQIMMLREDRNLLVAAHLSQLLDFVTGIGGFIIPLILWLTQKDKVLQMDEHGKQLVNFQISTFIYSILCIPLILFLGLGILGFIVLGVLVLIFPIINAIKASNGEPIYYPLSIQFLK